MTMTLCAQALAAHQAGDAQRVREILAGMGDAVLGDALLLQLLAFSGGEEADSRALLQLAAFDMLPCDSGAFFNLGVLEQEAGRLEQALLCYQQALRVDSTHLGALNNVSDLLRRQGRSEEAWEAISRYLALGGDTAGLEIRIAKIADDCGLVQEADHWFERAMARDPHSASMLWERAMQQLRDEDFARGWRGYEMRRGLFPHMATGIVSYNAPDWDGSPLNGRKLLVHKEQGLGDTLMFSSCLADIPGALSDIHLAVQPPLVRLMALNFPAAQVWPSVSMPGSEREEHQRWRAVAGSIDVQAPFGSLPLHLRAREFPAARAYLAASDADREVWRMRLSSMAPGSDGELRAGLVITARRDGMIGPGIAEGIPKSLPAHCARDLAIPGIAWFGLHDRATALDLARVPKLGVLDTSPWLQDMADTAALIAELDVVVAIDTAVAHLAGAMGKKVLLMLRHLSDWRWGRRRENSYWYPDVEVFRQSDEGDWAPVVTAVSRRLGELVRNKTA